MKKEVAAVVLAVLLSGCTSSDGDAETPDLADADAPGLAVEPGNVVLNETGPDLVNFTADGVPRWMMAGGCSYDLALAAVPASAAAPILPEGFTASPFASATLNVQDTTGSSAAVILAVSRCANGTAPNVEFGAATLATLGLAVEAPEPYAAEHVTQYYIAFSASSDSTLGGLFEQWGMGGVGSASVQATVDQSGPRVAQLSMRYEAITASATTTLPTTPSQRSPFVVRFFAVADGLVTGALDVDLPAGFQALGTSAAQLAGGPGPFAGPASAGLAVYVHGHQEPFRFRYVAADEFESGMDERPA